MNFFSSSLFFGVLVSLAGYEIGLALKKRFLHPLCNPLLISIALVMSLLLLLHIPYGAYNSGALYLSRLLTPATVCLAIPLHDQFSLLRRNWKALLAGIGAGVLASLCCVLAAAIAFGLAHREYVTLLPRSITTAIGTALSEELGGYPALTAAVIIIAGVLGNIFAESICRIFKITEPIAISAAIGTSSHAIGTSKAIEMGEVQGAISSLAIVVTGLLTVGAASLFARFL